MCHNTKFILWKIISMGEYCFLFQFNKCTEDCVLAKMGDPKTWGYALRTKWSIRDVISLDALCAKTAD